MKLTGWFPADVKPVRNGVYQVRVTGWPGEFYSYWNGKGWGLRVYDKNLAYRCRIREARGPVDLWRGTIREGK